MARLVATGGDVMSKVSGNASCPCGSGQKLKRCCGVFHRGRPAAPPVLMPARYTAFALGNVDFLIRTTHPQGPVYRADTRAWARELRAYCRATRFVGLSVLASNTDDALGRATVTFRALLEMDRDTQVLHERSLFLRAEGRWLYHSGELDPVDGPG